MYLISPAKLLHLHTYTRKKHDSSSRFIAKSDNIIIVPMSRYEEALSAVAPLKGLNPKRILFVCLGNICRSPAAHGIMNALLKERGAEEGYVIDSAGLYSGHAGDLPDRRMRTHAARRGYDLTHRARPVKSSDFDNFDLIVAMDDSNYDRLRSFAPTIETQNKVVKMIDFTRHHPYFDCIPDPYYDGAEGFENVLDLLEDATAGLYDAIEVRTQKSEL